jgi:hypothetical protein
MCQRALGFVDAIETSFGALLPWRFPSGISGKRLLQEMPDFLGRSAEI